VKKNILNFEPTFDFRLFAIVTHIRGYRLCWFLEQLLSFRLRRSEDLQLTSGREKNASFFQIFESEEEETHHQHITVLGNKTPSGFLIPEQNVVDFYIKLEGEFSDKEVERIENIISDKMPVQHVFRVDPDKLKSKQNLLL
jgi:hypothetical protein